MDSKAAAQNRSKLHFSYYDSTLPTRLADDVQRSSFTTRPKYLNALLEKVLSLPASPSASSHIDEFFVRVELFEMLPTERIRQLATTQNRNFDQMVKHLLEMALSHYPENSQMSVVARDLSYPTAEVYRSESAGIGYSRRPGMNHRPPATYDSSS